MRRAGTVDRGYGQRHKKLRAHWKAAVDRGEVACARCGRWIPPGGMGPCPAVHRGKVCGKFHRSWHLGHDDSDPAKRTYQGPEHVCCSTRAGLAKARALQPRRFTRLGRASRAW